MKNKLMYLTQKGYRDAFRMKVSNRCSKAILLSLDEDRYKLQDGIVYFAEEELSVEKVFDIGVRNNNESRTEDNLFVDAIFSYFYLNCDLRNESRFIVEEQNLKEYLCEIVGLDVEDVLDELLELEDTYGAIRDIGVFRLLELEHYKDILFIRLDYMQEVLNCILREADCTDNRGKALYYDYY